MQMDMLSRGVFFIKWNAKFLKLEFTFGISDGAGDGGEGGRVEEKIRSRRVPR